MAWIDGDLLTSTNLNNKSIGQTFNVKDAAYGAVGDGATDDTAAFQAARSAAYGQKLWVPQGVYLIDPSALTGAITIEGAGIDKTVLRCRSTATNNGFINTGGASVNSVILRDLTIDANRALNAANTSLRGLQIGPVEVSAAPTFSTGVMLQRVRVMGAPQHGVLMYYQRGTIVDNCVVDDFGNPAAGFGLALFRGCERCVVRDSYMSSQYSGTVGLALDDRSTDSVLAQPCRDNLILGNTIDGNDVMDFGISVEGSTGNKVIGNTVRNVEQVAIGLSSSDADSSPDVTADRNVVLGNRVSGQGAVAYAAIRIQGSYNVVQGNSISTCTGVGISQILPSDPALSSRGNIIAQNAIQHVLSGGILVLEGADTLIAENSLNSIGHIGIRLLAAAAASSGGSIARANVRGNVIANTVLDGIAVDSNTSGIHGVDIEGNQIVDWDRASAGGIYGIVVDKNTGALDNVALRGNTLTKTGSVGLTGVRLDGAVTNVRVAHNKTINVSTPFSNNADAGGLVYERGNSWNQREVAGTAAPTSGTWSVGDIVWNTAPAAGGVLGWVCTTGGTPGTWKTFGSVAA